MEKPGSRYFDQTALESLNVPYAVTKDIPDCKIRYRQRSLGRTPFRGADISVVVTCPRRFNWIRLILLTKNRAKTGSGSKPNEIMQVVHFRRRRLIPASESSRLASRS